MVRAESSYYYASIYSLFHAGIHQIRDVFNLVRSAEENWESIGLDLGLSESTLLTIKDDKKNVSRSCLYAVINLWLHSKAKKQPTWRVLIVTLKSDEVNESELADKIMKEKGTSYKTVIV